jgi:hypothetical protein
MRIHCSVLYDILFNIEVNYEHTQLQSPILGRESERSTRGQHLVHLPDAMKMIELKHAMVVRDPVWGST